MDSGSASAMGSGAASLGADVAAWGWLGAGDAAGAGVFEGAGTAAA